MSSMNMQKRFWIVLGAFMSIGLLVGGLLLSTSSVAAPVVAWNSDSIIYTIAPGQTQTIPFSLTALADLPTFVVRAVAPLAGLVQVNPSTNLTAQKGQTIQLTLTVSIPASAGLAVIPVKINLVFSTSPSGQAQLLPAQIIVTSNPVGLLPPDPGPAGMETLAGIDSDNDGVRDDIERYIWLTYPASEKTRMGLVQIAKADQEALVAAATGDASAAIAASHRSAAGTACLYYIAGSRAASVENHLTATELNTQQRWHAYAKLQGLLGGQGYAIPKNKKNQCTFDPDSLTN